VDLPQRRAHDRSGEFPLAICREAFKRGLMNSHIPTEYGGQHEAVLDHCMVMEELATGCSGIATAIDGNGCVAVPGDPGRHRRSEAGASSRRC